MKKDDKDIEEVKSDIDEQKAKRNKKNKKVRAEAEPVITAEDKKKILRKRAKNLAKEIEKTRDSDKYIDIVEFSLAQEKYGIQSEYVRQVCMLKDLTEVPCTPPHVLGIISLHEQIISVIDIRVFFDLKSPGITNLNRIIVLHSEKDNMEFGILADEIIGMNSIAESTIQRSLATLSDSRAKYFHGLSEDQTIILDGYKILTDKELILS